MSKKQANKQYKAIMKQYHKAYLKAHKEFVKELKEMNKKECQIPVHIVLCNDCKLCTDRKIKTKAK
jgi:hypothetical protein